MSEVSQQEIDAVKRSIYDSTDDHTPVLRALESLVYYYEVVGTPPTVLMMKTIKRASTYIQDMQDYLRRKEP